VARARPTVARRPRDVRVEMVIVAGQEEEEEEVAWLRRVGWVVRGRARARNPWPAMQRAGPKRSGGTCCPCGFSMSVCAALRQQRGCGVLRQGLCPESRNASPFSALSQSLMPTGQSAAGCGEASLALTVRVVLLSLGPSVCALVWTSPECDTPGFLPAGLGTMSSLLLAAKECDPSGCQASFECCRRCHRLGLGLGLGQSAFICLELSGLARHTHAGSGSTTTSNVENNVGRGSGRGLRPP
jgi:hypothetical protein